MKLIAASYPAFASCGVTRVIPLKFSTICKLLGIYPVAEAFCNAEVIYPISVGLTRFSQSIPLD